MSKGKGIGYELFEGDTGNTGNDNARKERNKIYDSVLIESLNLR